MSVQRNIVNRLIESKHLPEGLSMSEVRLSETVVVGGNWYWKSRGKCWTQPTDKSKPRQEIDEKEYREICAKAKNGVSDMSNKESPKVQVGDKLISSGEEIGTFISDDTIEVPAMATEDGQRFGYKLSSSDKEWVLQKAHNGTLKAKDIKSVGERISLEDKPKKSVDLPPARGDYYDVGNFYRVGRSGDFEKDMKFIQDREPGVTAKLSYGDKSVEYARKVGDNTWKTDSGKTLRDNDVASVAYDDGKVTLNYMIKNQPPVV